ncbi:MAG: hypothetical protein ACOYLS_14210 [Polymorphobacter sp.]
MRAAVAATLAAFAAATVACSAAETVDPDRFTKDIAKQIAAAAPTTQVVIDGPLTLIIKRQGSEDMQANLDRVFQFCQRNDAAACKLGIANYVDGTVSLFGKQDSPLADAITREKLRLIIRSADYCVQLTALLATGEKPDSPITQPFAEGLCAIVMFDFPKTRRSASLADLATLGLTRDAAMTAAKTQVLEALPKPTQMKFKKKAVFTFEAPDAPSLFLDTTGWQTVAAANPGLTFFAIAPDDGLFTIIPLEKDAVTEGIQRLAQEGFNAAERGISPYAYRWTNSGWQAIH